MVSLNSHHLYCIFLLNLIVTISLSLRDLGSVLTVGAMSTGTFTKFPHTNV